MVKMKTISVISATFISLFLSGYCIANEKIKLEKNDYSKVHTLEAVSVTGSRVPMQLGQSARIVTVLDSVAIASLPAKTINDILKYAVGVDVRQRGTFGMQTDISVRGGTFDQIAVLLNGINISDPHTGHNAADFPVDISEIDRIEILEGPSSRVYGTSSLVGAINIVTKSENKGYASVHTEGGSFGYFNIGGRVNIVNGRFNNQLSANYSRSDGYSRNLKGGLNSDFKALKTFYRGGYRGHSADVNWQLGISSKGFGANTFYSAKFDNQFEKTLKTFASVQAETKGILHFRPVAYWNYSTDRFELFRNNFSAYPFNHHKTNVFGLNLGSWFETILGKTAFGAEMRVEDLISTNLGLPLKNPLKVPGYDANYKMGFNRTVMSYYIEHNFNYRNLTASAGIMAAGATGNEAGFGFYPGVDMSYRFFDNWKLYASYNTSYRLPTITELFYSVGGHKADRYLKPDRMQAIEGGLKYLRPGVSVIFSTYYHIGSSMIDWIKDLSLGSAAEWTSVNHTKLNTLGEEVTARIDFPALLSKENFFLKQINIGYSHIGQNKVLAPNIQSRYAMEYLRNKIVAQIDFHIWNRLFMNLSYRWNDRVGGYELFENGVSTNTKVDYKPYSLLDCGLSWNADKYRIYVEANNLLNKSYYDHGNIPQPGLWIRAGVVLNFNL